MKITTIKYMERKNLGNYEHEELSAEAVIGETEDYVASMLSLKDLVHNTLHGTLNKEIVAKAEVFDKIQDGINKMHETTLNPVADLIPPKAKKKVAKKVADVQATSPTIEEAVVVEDIVSQSKEEVKAKPSKVTKYDSNVPEHKSIFGSYLAKAYGDAWKTVAPKEDIKNFTASLNGLDFIDNNGIMVDSFLVTVKGFFGA
jgi:hypothetical protein